MAVIDHRPCLTDDEIAMRIVVDQRDIHKMIQAGYEVKAMIGWHSPTTLETHCLPIFSFDTLSDVINRYYDFFPKECLATVQDCEHISRNLFSSDGMSPGKTIMSSFKIPLGLWKLLEAWEPGFFDVDPGTKNFKHKTLIKRFLSLMPKLRTKAPYGRHTVAVA